MYDSGFKFLYFYECAMHLCAIFPPQQSATEHRWHTTVANESHRNVQRGENPIKNMGSY